MYNKKRMKRYQMGGATSINFAEIIASLQQQAQGVGASAVQTMPQPSTSSLSNSGASAPAPVIDMKKGLGSALSSGANPVAGIATGVAGTASGIQKLTDNDTGNQGTGWGQTIGSATDATLGAFGIPTFGAGQALGSVVGGLFDKPEDNRAYRPSGNTTGAYKDYKLGGSLPTYKTIRTKQMGGFYGTYPRSTSRPGEESKYEFYLPKDKARTLDSLNKEYNFPPGFMESIAMIESGRGKKIDGKLAFTPFDSLTSHRGAQGPFQFMPATGKARGLKTEADRRNFEKAASASAEKFADDRRKQDSLTRAVMAYNWGSGNLAKKYDAKGEDLPKETKNYLEKINEYQEKLAGYPSSLGINSIPVVTAPRPQPWEVIPGTAVDWPQGKKAVNVSLQLGGQADAQIEIEGGEYVFNNQGLDENNFKMLDNTGKSSKSNYGFMAQGKDHHPTDNSAGIKVSEGDAYIASKYLGMDGTKTSKKNPSVASMMLKNGGKALAKASEHDKYAINGFNPKALQHHLKMMNNVKDVAEANKAKQEQKQAYKAGGNITASIATMIPSPSSYNKGIGNYDTTELNEIKRERRHAMDTDIKIFKDGGSLDSLSFSKAFAESRKQGLGEFSWRGNKYHTKTKSEMSTPQVTSAEPVAKSSPLKVQNITYTADLPEVEVVASRNRTADTSSSRPTPFIKPSFQEVSDTITSVPLSSPSSSKVNQLLEDIPIKKYEGLHRTAKMDDKGNPLVTDKKYMILHQTGAKGDHLVKGRELKDEDGKYYTGAHYYIMKDGTIHNPVDESYVVNHAGKGRIGEDTNLNDLAVGLEFEAGYNQEAGRSGKSYYEDFTPQQLEAGSKLIANWIIKNKISPQEAYQRIFGHSQISSYDKNKKGEFLDPLDTADRRGFGDRFWSQARKVDFDNQTYSVMMDAVNEELKKRGYITTKKLGGYTDYEKYYHSLPLSKKELVAQKLNKLPKAQQGGQIQNILDEMYSQEELYFINK